MKRWFRPVAYSIILLLLALAIFGRSAEPMTRADLSPHAAAARTHATPPFASPQFGLQQRGDGALAPSLFKGVAKPEIQESAPPVEVVVPAAPVELKMLGWMLADATPTVFVAYGNENYTLAPTQSVQDLYRFEKIGDGEAVFTYLPTGESKTYAVTDPALSE